MNQALTWWQKPRRISVVVDNPSWILSYAEALVAALKADGDDAYLCRSHDVIEDGAVAFYLGCLTLTPPDVIARNQRNLVVHESALPQGRGFSPLSWQILEGCNEIPVCLIEAATEADSGPIIYEATLRFDGDELIDEMRAALGALTADLCRRFLDEPTPPVGQAQSGAATTYPRRQPVDSRLDPERSLADQFDLLRVVDDDKYPAFFEMRGHRYKVAVSKMGLRDDDD